MASKNDELEPLHPEDAYELFLEHKATESSESTVQNYKYRLKPLVAWCEEQNLDNLNDLSGRDINKYSLRRKRTADLTPLTMKNHLTSLRLLLRWCGSVEAVPENLYDKVMVTRVRRGYRSREEMLDAETAQEILDYLSRYYYASIEHALLALLWETGIRIGAVFSLDVDDVDSENQSLQHRHRPDKGTTLKNGEAGERPIALTPELSELL